MKKSYRAMEVAEGGQLTLVSRNLPDPAQDEVLLAVEACGICGADRGDIQNADPAEHRVPGHEVVGRIIAKGAGVPDSWAMGQRVGVGRFGGPCGACRACRAGLLSLCRQQPVTGSTRDGGYAECMTARASGLVAIPDSLASAEAAPILCAGIATFQGLKHAGVEAGDTVAVLGIGGLGHMALQYARAMGFRTVALGRGRDIAENALSLGAHHYVDLATEDPIAALSALGGASAIISTIGDMATVARVMPGLAQGGRLLMLGIGKDPLQISSGLVVGGERSVQGSITGSPYDNERTLDFSVLTGIRPRIETLPLERAQEAFDRMASGAVTFRMVLTMEQTNAPA